MAVELALQDETVRNRVLLLINDYVPVLVAIMKRFIISAFVSVVGNNGRYLPSMHPQGWRCKHFTRRGNS